MAKSPGVRSHSGWVNRLWVAVEYNDIHSVKQMIHHGCDINHVFKEHGHHRRGLSPIFIAVSKNFKDLVKLLVNEGCKLEQEDAYGETPLFSAVRGGKLPMIQQLIDAGADVNHLNSKGENVLFLAIRWGRKDLVDYLTRLGVDVDVVNGDGCTPLLLAIELMSDSFLCTKRATRRKAPSNMVEISEALIPLSSNLNHNHPNKGAALRITLAAEKEHCPQNLHISKLLMQHGAVPDRMFFLRFGLHAATTAPGSQFFTHEFFSLAVQAGAAIQKEKTWILHVLQQMAEELEPYEELFEDLLNKSTSPLPLYTVCQIFIRTRLSGKLWKKIDALPLPSSVKDFLKLKHVPC